MNTQSKTTSSRAGIGGNATRWQRLAMTALAVGGVVGWMAAPAPAGAAEVIKLENAGTERCLNIHRGRHDFQGAPVTSYSCASTRDQRWELIRLRNGYVKLRNQGTGRCLNIHRGRHDYQGAPVTSYSCADTPDQEWDLMYLSNGRVKLRNLGSGRCLNIHRGRHDFEGGPATSYSCANTPDQEWSLTHVSGGVSCRLVGSLGRGMADEIVEELNREVAGEVHRINRRKSLRINRVLDVAFNGCEARVRADVTLKRKIRRNAHGPITMAARIVHLDLREQVLCLDKARVSSVKLSRTTRLGEAMYRWVANKVMPSRRCFSS